MDTPRRARASIGKRIDDYIAPIGEFLEAIGSGAGHFTFGDKLDAFVPLFEKIADALKKPVGIGLVVIKQTTARVI